MTESDLEPAAGVAGEPVHHESAPLHVSGGAFTPTTSSCPPARCMPRSVVAPAHARVRRLDLDVCARGCRRVSPSPPPPTCGRERLRPGPGG
jgi:xanthine dehydrogenase molybdopterin-binding subunit B